MADPTKKPKPAAVTGGAPDALLPPPIEELIARFQLDSERAIAAVRRDLTGLYEQLATKVAVLEDRVVLMTEAATRQAGALDEGLHHTRKAVEETNEAMKVAAQAAREAADSAAVYEKLKDSQPDFAALVRGLETRLAAVVDEHAHVVERLGALGRQVDQLELGSGAFE